MSDYLSKPVRPDVLAKTLQHWLPPKGGTQDARPGEPDDKPPDPGFSTTPLCNAAVFDRAALLARMMQDAELAQEIARTFIDDSPKHLRALEQALSQGDAAQAGRHAHTLKGAAANVSGEALREVACQMEKAGKSGDLESLCTRLGELKQQHELLCHHMRQELLRDDPPSLSQVSAG